jgi:hypothetical protein
MQILNCKMKNSEVPGFLPAQESITTIYMVTTKDENTGLATEVIVPFMVRQAHHERERHNRSP